MPPSPAPSTARQRVLGTLFLMGAVACFAGIDSCAKWLNRSLPPLQTVTARYLGSFIIIILLLNPRTHPGIMGTRRPWLQIARGVCLVIMSLCIFSALRFLALTVSTSIAFVAPLITAVLAAPLLGETLGPRRVAAVIVGFIGVLVITRPWTGSFHPAMLLVLLTACLNALYSIATRLLAAHDSPRTTMFYTGLVAAIIVLPLLGIVWETPTSPRVWLVIGMFSVFGAVGHWLLILAHTYAPASALAPYFYTQLIWAVIIGITIFGERPDRWTVLGGAIIMSSGLYLLYRERVRQRSPSVDVGV